MRSRAIVGSENDRAASLSNFRSFLFEDACPFLSCSSASQVGEAGESSSLLGAVGFHAATAKYLVHLNNVVNDVMAGNLTFITDFEASESEAAKSEVAMKALPRRSGQAHSQLKRIRRAATKAMQHQPERKSSSSFFSTVNTHHFGRIPTSSHNTKTQVSSARTSNKHLASPSSVFSLSASSSSSVPQNIDLSLMQSAGYQSNADLMFIAEHDNTFFVKGFLLLVDMMIADVTTYLRQATLTQTSK